jgi:hypothetical protein
MVWALLHQHHHLYLTMVQNRAVHGYNDDHGVALCLRSPHLHIRRGLCGEAIAIGPSWPSIPDGATAATTHYRKSAKHHRPKADDVTIAAKREGEEEEESMPLLYL